MAKQVVNVGAGIVADSNPAAEYEETLAKAAGFLAALKVAKRRMEISPAQRAGIIVPKSNRPGGTVGFILCFPASRWDE
jgi:hypothetical protein